MDKARIVVTNPSVLRDCHTNFSPNDKIAKYCSMLLILEMYATISVQLDEI